MPRQQHPLSHRGLPALTMRAAQEADAVEIAALLATPQDLRQVSPEEDFPLDAATVRHWIRARSAGYVLEERGRVVAYAELVEDAGVAGRLWIGHMMVEPQRRGLGLGRRLVTGLLRIASEERRAREVAISAFADNPRALRCYRGCGFVDRGHVRVGARDLVELRFRIPGEQPVVNLTTAAGATAVGASVGALTLLPLWRTLDWVALLPILGVLVLAAWVGYGIVPRRRAARAARLWRTASYPGMIGIAVYAAATLLHFLRGIELGPTSIAIAVGTATSALLLVLAARREDPTPTLYP